MFDPVWGCVNVTALPLVIQLWFPLNQPVSILKHLDADINVDRVPNKPVCALTVLVSMYTLHVLTACSVLRWQCSLHGCFPCRPFWPLTLASHRYLK